MSAKRAPVITATGKPEDDYDLDPDLKRIVTSNVANEPYNNEVCYYLDPMVQAYTSLSIYNLFGRGIEIQVPKNVESQNKIRKFNRRINNRNDTIEDLIVSVWVDNVIHGFHLSRVADTISIIDQSRMIDLSRIPEETITIKEDSINAYRIFLQSNGPTSYYKSYEDFLKGTQTLYPLSREPISISDHPKASFYISFFKRPPMASISYLVIYKRWLWMFLRKFAEKMSTPIWLAYVGGDKGKTNNIPLGEQEMADALTQVKNTLIKLKNFSVGVFPGNVTIEPWEPKNNGETFLKYIAAIDEQIMFGLMASMGMVESQSVYKGNVYIAEQQIRFYEAVRKKIENSLKVFYMHNITPEIDNEDDIKFIWPELRVADLSGIVNAFKECVNAEVFVDAKERREAAAKFFEFLANRVISQEEAKKMDDLRTLIAAPSQPGENTVDIKNKSKKTEEKTPKTT